MLFAVGIFFAFLATCSGDYYIGEYASTVAGVPQLNSINLLILMNGIGLIGRLVPAYFSNRYTGPLNLLVPLVFL